MNRTPGATPWTLSRVLSNLARPGAIAASIITAALCVSLVPTDAAIAAEVDAVDGNAVPAATTPMSVADSTDSPDPDGEGLGSPFDHNFGLASYAVGWHGAYGGAGLGGRLRWEAIPDIMGIEAFSEHLWIATDDRLRHDHPIGFNLYFPVTVSDEVRLRPLFGACTVFSFIEPTDKHGQRTDDVQFGVHAGLGVEVELAHDISFFADAQGIAYVGHDRDYGGWTTSVSEDLAFDWVVQATMGVQVHLSL